MYSETLYFCLLLCASSIIYYFGADRQQTKYLVLALPLLSYGTVVRSPGLLNFIIPVYFILHKLIRLWFLLIKPGTQPKLGCRHRCNRFVKSIKSQFAIILSILFIAFIPFLTISVWKPYEGYCLSRLDTYF